MGRYKNETVGARAARGQDHSTMRVCSTFGQRLKTRQRGKADYNR